MIFESLLAKRQTAPATPGQSGGAMSLFKPPVAGVRVDEQEAMTYGPLWACVRVISETMASLPWGVHRKKGNVREAVTDHHIYRLLHRRPNPETIPFRFKETLVAHALTWGNGYAEIERNRVGEPIALWIITPDRVTPDRDARGNIIYKVTNDQEEDSEIPARDMFHLPCLAFDGLKGYSVVNQAKQAISLGIATEQFGAAFFGNGAHLGGVITKEPGSGDLSQPAIKNLLSSFNKKHRGAANSNKVHYLDAGLKYDPIGIPPEDAQFLETRRFQTLDMCRWFRVPPHKLAELDRATHNNIESQNIEFVTDVVVPWATRLEQEADFKLFDEDESELFTKLNVNALLRGDTAARQSFYTAMLDRGVFDIDEVRAREDMNPLPQNQGQLRLVQANMMSVERAIQEGGTEANARASDRRGTSALWEDPANRMVRKEINALSRMADKGIEAGKLADFYESHQKHLVEAFSSIATFDGVQDLEARARDYVLDSCKGINEQQYTLDLLADWRLSRSETLRQFMGDPNV
ncbi:phage portal protein [Marinobacter salinus]|uniref:Phage portal protein n=1 Tax=Marinobacter salinus TaxID=1874317 RepID=A0A1D9GLX2_9GAMM|nr:phage portal protein [Marinobacter salinus]AOY88643.1 phage portal protein [Marinobacter salinus]